MYVFVYINQIYIHSHTHTNTYVGPGCIYHAWGGTCLGMEAVWTGSEMVSRLNPRNAPKKMSGSDTPNLNRLIY